MSARDRWVLLAYRVPREPSAPRLAIWRKLRRLGVAKLGDGLVALPLDSRNREQLEWTAEEIIESGGHASVWLADPTTGDQSRELAEQMCERIAAEYLKVSVEAQEIPAGASNDRRRILARLRRELGRIRRRDYFPTSEREQAHRAVEALATDVEQELAA